MAPWTGHKATSESGLATSSGSQRPDLKYFFSGIINQSNRELNLSTACLYLKLLTSEENFLAQFVSISFNKFGFNCLELLFLVDVSRVSFMVECSPQHEHALHVSELLPYLTSHSFILLCVISKQGLPSHLFLTVIYTLLLGCIHHQHQN